MFTINIYHLFVLDGTVMMILDYCPRPLTSHFRPYALAWAATMIGLRPTTYASLFTRVLLLTTAIQGFNAFSGLRLLYCVIPTALKHIYVMRFLYSRGLAVICTAMLHSACLH